jgi:glycerophosphoryl diester phosphodiesterase
LKINLVKIICFAAIVYLPTSLAFGQTITNGTYGPYNPLPPSSDNKLTGIFDNKVYGLALSTLMNGTSKMLSPSNFYTLAPNVRYSAQIPYVVAHRGLVDIYRGIPENTLAAINNAVQNGLFLVEIDVQSSADNIAIATHDDSAHRTLNISNNFAKMNGSSVINNSILIQNPLYNQSGINPGYNANSLKQYYTTSENQRTLQYLMDNTDNRVTFFVDPKNLKAAQAVARLAMTDNKYSSRIFMKTYDEFWEMELSNPELLASGNNPVAADAIYNLCGSSDTSCQSKLTNMRIAPVVNVWKHMNCTTISLSTDCNSSLNTVTRIVSNWGKYFEVQAVELPGSWANGWKYVATAFRLWALSNGNKLPKNSIDGVYYSPLISSGYRFEDFAQYTGGSSPVNFYDWNMKGLQQPDTVNSQRRTVCGQQVNFKGFGATAHQNSVDSVVSFITTDLPMQEVYCANYVTSSITFLTGNPSGSFTYGATQPIAGNSADVDHQFDKNANRIGQRLGNQ